MLPKFFRSILGIAGRGRLVGGSSGVSIVLHVGNIATVGVVHPVVDSLGPAVGKSHAVGAGGGVTVAVFGGVKVDTRIVVGHGVVVGVGGGLVVGGRLVCRGSVGGSGGMVDWCDGGAAVGDSGGAVDWSSATVGGSGGGEGRTTKSDGLGADLLSSGAGGKQGNHKQLKIIELYYYIYIIYIL